MTTSSTPDRGRALLMSTAAASFVLSAALVAGPALAANECGTPSNGSVTCTSAGNPFATGITYQALATDLTVVTDATVAATGPVSVTGSSGNVTANNAGSINTSTANVPGINAYSTSGNATIINSGTVSTSGVNAPGLSAISAAANATVTSTGSVSTSGATSDGVDAIARAGGNATVTVGDVSVTGPNSAGVFALSSGGGTVNVTVNQGSTVSATGAGDAGVVMGALPSANNATMTLDNNGTITAGTGDYSVITVSGSGAALINNNSTGRINGPITLSGGLPNGVGNTVNNAGAWNVPATTTSTFGAPGTNNVLNNTGIITVDPSAQNAPPSTANFANLTTFNNAGGVVDLTTGNSLNIENAQFIGGVGPNNQQSTLRVNANRQTGELFVNSTPNGATRVVLADVPGTNPAMNLRGQTIVSGTAAGAGPSFGSFNFGAPGINDQHAGFVDYRLVFNQATQNTASSFALFGLPGPEVFEALNITYALQDFWRHSAFTVTQRQMSLRDSLVGEHPSRVDGWEFWAQPYGGEDFFKRPQLFQFGGFFFPSVGNHNDTVGLQIGADMLGHFGSGQGIGFLGIGGAGTGYWGFTGGIEQQTTHFPGDDANTLYSVGGNVGLYGGASWGGFYVNALGKVDFDNMNTNFFTAGNFSPTNTFKAYGVRGEVGYRWPWSGFFVEPSARVSAIWNDDINNLNPAGALIRLNDGSAGVFGEAGGRVGTTFNLGRFLPGPVGQFNPFPGQFNIYFGAWWADQWDGRNSMTFTTLGGVNGPTTIGLTQATTGPFIHSEYGVETADWYGGLKLFLKGENNFDGESVGGWSAQAGVRWSF